MFLIQILLPLRDNQGKPIARRHFTGFSTRLTGKFGGVTVYSRAPATGLWKKNSPGKVERDDIVIFEVMSAKLARQWWSRERRHLESLFRQHEVIVRAFRISAL